ncbi:DUF6186 family protein [Geodermatophilus sp. CPCC 206100]|uniref:DUF6186 family protein n=1 Tax=Geodermatophilus sp. CPCC 206100 TaxID=3020054 RepID=UPI003B00D289
MTGAVLAVAGFVALGAAGAGLALAARHSPDRATPGQAVAAAMRTLPGRVAVLAAWLWLGVHFLAR